MPHLLALHDVTCLGSKWSSTAAGQTGAARRAWAAVVPGERRRAGRLVTALAATDLADRLTTCAAATRRGLAPSRPCAGGTKIAVALRRGLDLIEQNQAGLKKADLVLTTHGGSDTVTADSIRTDALRLGVTILGLGIGVEREWLQPWCDEVETVTGLTTIDETSATKLFAA